MYASQQRVGLACTGADAFVPYCRRDFDTAERQDAEKVVLELEIQVRVCLFQTEVQRRRERHINGKSIMIWHWGFKVRKDKKTSKKYQCIRMVWISQLAFHSKSCDSTWIYWLETASQLLLSIPSVQWLTRYIQYINLWSFWSSTRSSQKLEPQYAFHAFSTVRWNVCTVNLALLPVSRSRSHSHARHSSWWAVSQAKRHLAQG